MSDPSVLDAADRAARAARAAGIPVMFVRVAFRPGYPEAAESNLSFGAVSKSDLDYRITVLADACADRDPEVHRVLTEKVFPRQALVTSTDEWISGL